ncbi:MAG: thioredoxin family protein [Rectinemataceae bacterium]
MTKQAHYLIAALAAILLASSFGKAAAQDARSAPKALVTFTELGSVNCVPCKAMRPIMTDIETSYDGRVKVVFYDIWTKKGEPFGRKYGIRVIPTQVFLDKDGMEFYRHEGFSLASDIKKLLTQQGSFHSGPLCRRRRGRDLRRRGSRLFVASRFGYCSNLVQEGLRGGCSRRGRCTDYLAIDVDGGLW